MLIPCHNETLDWVDSATDAPRHDGFNAFGRAVIGECNRLGMIVDGAHVSHEGIRRLIDVSEAPILLSHSNAFSLCDHPRNAPDDVLKRLKDERRRRAWRPSCPASSRRPCATGSERSRDAYGKAPPVADPKAQLAELEDAPRRRRRARRWPRSPTTSSISSRRRASITSASAPTSSAARSPQGLEHVGRFPHLFAELIRRGFSERDLEKIANRNVLRVMRKVERVGEVLREVREPAVGQDRGLSGAVRGAGVRRRFS